MAEGKKRWWQKNPVASASEAWEEFSGHWNGDDDEGTRWAAPGQTPAYTYMYLDAVMTRDSELTDEQREAIATERDRLIAEANEGLRERLNADRAQRFSSTNRYKK